MVHTHTKRNYFQLQLLCNFSVFFLHCFCTHQQHQKTVLLCFMLHCKLLALNCVNLLLSALYLDQLVLPDELLRVFFLTFCSASQRVELCGNCSNSPRLLRTPERNFPLTARKNFNLPRRCVVTFPNTPKTLGTRLYELLQLRALLGVD